MNKIVFLFALVAVVVAEPPVNYGAPQEYSAPSYSAPSFSYSSYSDSDDGSQYVDDALLARIAQILEQSESSSGYSSGGYSAPSSSYGAPSSSYGAPSSGYGAPTRSSGIVLGRPEVAQRVAEFDLTETRSSGGYSSGGYN